MIKIDKHNIEAYYLDYLEGNLSVEDTTVLLSFIDDNPEFSELFADTDDLLSIQLLPSAEQFRNIDDLKSLPCSDDEICLSNIDYWLIAKAEKTLSKPKVESVDRFVIENKLEVNESLISGTYLQPNLSETFGDTSVLKKEEGVIISILLRFTSIAAIFLFMWLVWNPSESVERKYMSRTIYNETNKEVEYVSPQTSPSLITIPANQDISTKTLQRSNTLASTRSKNELVVPKRFSDFKLLNEPINNIIVPSDLAFSNPPKLLLEDIDLNSIFSDYEEAIANNIVQTNNDFAQVNSKVLKYELEEQYRPVTRTLSNLTSLNMSYKKMPEASDISQTVIQIGKFSFERKKKK